VLWWFADCFSILQHHLTLDVAHGSGGALCTPTYPISGSGLSPTYVSPSAFLAFVYWKFAWRSAPWLFSLLQCASSTLPPLLHVPFQFLVYSFLLGGGGSVCPGCYAGLSQGWLWEYHVMLVAHLLICRMSSKQVWSLCLVAWEPSCFLSVMWHGKLCMGWVFRVSNFCFFSVFFFCQVWLQSLSKSLDLQSSCWLLLHSSHHWIPPPWISWRALNSRHCSQWEHICMLWILHLQPQ
jgi:hypothetical protein